MTTEESLMHPWLVSQLELTMEVREENTSVEVVLEETSNVDTIMCGCQIDIVP
jgi:hypothetical protein